MKNPWLNINPLASVWLRNSNAALGSVRAPAAMHARLQIALSLRLRNQHKDMPDFSIG